MKIPGKIGCGRRAAVWMSACAAAALAAIFPSLANAQNVSDWTGNAGDGLWTDPNNWNNGVPGPNDDADLSIPGSTIDLNDGTNGGNVSVGMIEMFSLTTPYDIIDSAPGGLLTVTQIIAGQSSGTDQVSANITSTNTFISIDGFVSPSTLAITGVIQDEGPSQPVSVGAGGTLEGANTYSGSTSVIAGTTLALAGDGTILNTNGVSVADSVLVLDDRTTSIQQRINPVASITLWSGQLVYQGSESGASQQDVSDIELTGGSNTIEVDNNNSATNGSALLTATQLDRGSENATLYINLNTNGNSGSANFTLGTAPTLIGNATASAGDKDLGILPWAISTANGSTDFLTYDSNGFRVLAADEYASAPTAGDNVKLQSNQTVASNLAINSLIATAKLSIASGQTLTVSSGAVALSGSNGIISGGATAKLEFGTPEAVLYADNSSNQINAVIDGTGGLTKFGPGTLHLTQPNTYTGNTVINEGTLAIGAQGALGTGNIIFPSSSNSTLEFDTVNQSYSNSIGTYNAGSISVAAGHMVTLSGSVSGANGTFGELQQVGAGTVILTGGGTTLNYICEGGTVDVDSNFGLRNGNYNGEFAAGGGTVSGNGNVNNLFMGSGAISPTGRLSAVSIDVSGGTFIFHLNGPNAGATSDGYDQLRVDDPDDFASNTVILETYSNLDISLGFTPTVGEHFVLIDNVNPLDTVSGNFNGLPEGSDFSVSNVEFQITYQADADNDGADNDVMLTVISVPEPASAALFLVPATLLLLRRQRKG